jgi:hypothetical protein
MKFEIGEYIRTKNGYIAKLKEIDKEHYEEIYKFNKAINSGDEWNLYKSELKDYITKHSKNIIDLIEENDLVNDVFVEKNNGKYLETLDIDYECSSIGHIEYIRIYDNEIYSVVTHEQLKQIEYKVDNNIE